MGDAGKMPQALQCGDMEAGEIIDTLLSATGTTQSELAKATGRTKQAVCQAMARGTSMRYATFHRMADTLGYEIVLRKKKGKGRQ